MPKNRIRIWKPPKSRRRRHREPQVIRMPPGQSKCSPDRFDILLGSIHDFFNVARDAEEEAQIPNDQQEIRRPNPAFLPNYNGRAGDVLPPLDRHTLDLIMQHRSHDEEDFRVHAEGLCNLPRRRPEDVADAGEYCHDCHYLLDEQEIRRQVRDPRHLRLVLAARDAPPLKLWSPLKGFLPFTKHLRDFDRPGWRGVRDTNLNRHGLHFDADNLGLALWQSAHTLTERFGGVPAWEQFSPREVRLAHADYFPHGPAYCQHMILARGVDSSTWGSFNPEWGDRRKVRWCQARLAGWSTLWQLVSRVGTEPGPEDLYVMAWGRCRIYATRWELTEEYGFRLDDRRTLESFRTFSQPSLAQLAITDARSLDQKMPSPDAHTLYNFLVHHEPALSYDLIARAWTFSSEWLLHRERTDILWAWGEDQIGPYALMVQAERNALPIAVGQRPPIDQDGEREQDRPLRQRPVGGFVSFVPLPGVR